MPVVSLEKWGGADHTRWYHVGWHQRAGSQKFPGQVDLGSRSGSPVDPGSRDFSGHPPPTLSPPSCLSPLLACPILHWVTSNLVILLCGAWQLFYLFHWNVWHATFMYTHACDSWCLPRKHNSKPIMWLYNWWQEDSDPIWWEEAHTFNNQNNHRPLTRWLGRSSAWLSFLGKFCERP